MFATRILYRFPLLSGLFFEVWLKALCDGALGRWWKEGGCFWPGSSWARFGKGTYLG